MSIKTFGGVGGGYCCRQGTFAVLLLRAVVVFALVVAVDIVEGVVTCSRCKATRRPGNKPRPLMYVCSEGDGRMFVRTPDAGSPNPCDCTGFPRPALCTLSEDQTSCFCRESYPDRCLAGKCDYAYQCGSTLYVCWNLVSPVDLGVCLEECDAVTGRCFENCDGSDNPEIQSLAYCEDRKDNNLHNLDSLVIDCNGLCSLDPNILDNNPDSIIGTEICPNGETVTSYTKFCAPEGENGVPEYPNGFERCDDPDFPYDDSRCVLPSCDMEFGTCLRFGGFCERVCALPFCSFGEDRTFHLTLYTAPTTLPTTMPSIQPTNKPTPKPTKRPKSKRPTTKKRTKAPVKSPTLRPAPKPTKMPKTKRPTTKKSPTSKPHTNVFRNNVPTTTTTDLNPLPVEEDAG
jgi:hypothetical protein